ncbi:MAG: HAMP domain-containing sensor histidine kinase [Bacteroidota bacterium]
MFKTIRTKLLVILLSFILTTIIMSVVVFSYFQSNKDSLSHITQSAEKTHVLLLKDIKITHEFFENETINPHFFETGKSDLITEHLIICNNLSRVLSDLNLAQRTNHFQLNDSIENMEKEFSKYKLLTAELFKQILVRGFKNFGIEGEMRKHAHDLENYSKEIGLVNILQLRRHEKDFIIRQEDPYIIKHNELIATIKDELSVNNSIDATKKSEIIKTLNNYSIQFNSLVAYEKKLGLKSGKGLKMQMDNISNRIEASLAAMVEFSAKKEQAAIANVKLVYLIIGLIFIAIGIVVALAISKRVSRSITFLKEKIDEFVKSDFTSRTVLPISNSTDEIDVLTNNFSIMEQHIVNQMNSLKLSNNDLEMLFYATSHDIKSPLLKVKELTQSASQKTTEPLIKEYLNLINQSWEKLINTVDELGIITNVRSEEIKPETINLESLIRSVYSEFNSLPGFDTIIFSLDVSVKNGFFSSPGLLKAIFRNLIENSIKYSTKRNSFSFLKISITSQTDDMLKMEISDNGIGIKKEHHDKIFDMFYRGTDHITGTGLGLYIVKCSVEKLHGAIAFESNEDVGTSFSIVLPNNYKVKNIRERIIHEREIAGFKDFVLN